MPVTQLATSSAGVRASLVLLALVVAVVAPLGFLLRAPRGRPLERHAGASARTRLRRFPGVDGLIADAATLDSLERALGARASSCSTATAC